MRVWAMLLRRELWEHPNAFVWTPLVIALLVTIVGGFVSGGNSEISVSFTGSGTTAGSVLPAQLWILGGPAYLAEVAPAARPAAVRSALVMATLPLRVVLLFTLFFFLVRTLYDDRRDRSVLFWKSMPVADSVSVGAKLMAGALLVPGVYAFAGLATQGVTLVVVSLRATALDLPAGELIWSPAGVPQLILMTVVDIVFRALWMFPVLAWLLAVSAWARSSPALVATGVPLVVIIVEAIFLPTPVIGSWLVDHVWYSAADGPLPDLMAKLVSLNMVVSLVLGVVFFAIAVRLRHQPLEI